MSLGSRATSDAGSSPIRAICSPEESLASCMFCASRASVGFSLEKESAVLCPGRSPTLPDVMAQAVSSSLRGLSLHLHTIPGFRDAPNPMLRNVINSCQVQRVPPVLKLPGSLSFSFFGCEQPGGHSCVSFMLLSPTTSPRPHRVDAPSKICQ